MKVEVHTRNLEAAGELIRYVHRRLKFAIGNRFDAVKSIKVNLSDINGPKGGNDKRCLILVTMKGQPDLVVESKHTHIHTAIDEAAEKANRTIVKRIKRANKRKNIIRKMVTRLDRSRKDRYLDEDFRNANLNGGW